MRRKPGPWVVSVSALTLVLFSGVTHAQTNRGGDVRPPANVKGRSGAENAPGQTPQEAAPRPRPRDARELIARLRELREAMQESLELTEEQTEPIDEMFEAHFEMLRASIEENAEQDMEERRARVAELREAMKTAREEGDKEKARALRQELKELRDSSRRMPFERTGAFIEEVGSVLSKEQLKTYRQIVRRLRLPISHDRRMGKLRWIMQTIRNPEMNLSEEQQANIRTILREGMGSAERPGGEPTDRAAQLAEIERRILAELTEEQREKLDRISQRNLQRTRERLREPRVIKGREYPAKVAPENEATNVEPPDEDD
jgi:hypothetical protein